MPDKKEELENQIAHMIGYEDWGDKTAEDVARDILSLIAPILEKAEKWDRVEEIAKMFDIEGCEGCPMINTPYHICGNAWCVVDALEGEGEKE